VLGPLVRLRRIGQLRHGCVQRPAEHLGGLDREPEAARHLASLGRSDAQVGPVVASRLGGVDLGILSRSVHGAS
jgi:hypothetical protein